MDSWTREAPAGAKSFCERCDQSRRDVIVSKLNVTRTIRHARAAGKRRFFHGYYGH